MIIGEADFSGKLPVAPTSSHICEVNVVEPSFSFTMPCQSVFEQAGVRRATLTEWNQKIYNCSNMSQNADPMTYKKPHAFNSFTVKNAAFPSGIPSTPGKSAGIRLVDELIRHLGLAGALTSGLCFLGIRPPKCPIQ